MANTPPPNPPELADSEILIVALEQAKETMQTITQLGHGHSDEWRKMLGEVTAQSADVVTELGDMQRMLKQQAQEGK